MRSNSTSPLSAPSRIAWAPNAWPAGYVVLTVIGLLVVIVVSTTLYAIVARALGHFDPKSPDTLLQLQIAVYVPWALFLLVVLPRLARAPLAELGFRKPTAIDLGVGVVGAVVMWIAVSGIGSAIVALSHQKADEAAIVVLHGLKTPFQKALFAAIGIVLGPMVEELTFRVFLFNAFTRYASVLGAALASGALFGLAHVQGEANQLAGQLLTISIPLALGGMVLAYVYARTRSYWSNVTAHGLFNAVSIVAVLGFHAK